MLKLTVILSAALYALLVIFSDGQVPSDAPSALEVERADSVVNEPLIGAQNVASEAVDDAELRTPDGRILAITAHFDPAQLVSDDRAIQQVSTRDVATVEIVTASASMSEALTIVEVTGNSVNLRAGPSTGNAVLTALQRGRQAELLETLDNGWAQIRVLDTGVEGFMADRFLATVN